MGQIAVLVPTMRRPESLARALRSLFAQDAPQLIAQIVVVDNSPEASARATVDALRSASPVALTYVHEPRPGVATARNAGLAAAHASYGAAVTFGPVQGVTPPGTGWAAPYLDRFFSRLGPETSGPIEEAYGCGNSIMTRALALPGPAPFDTGSDETGGEDDKLFAALRARGGGFAWAADAPVLEHAPADRAKLSYALWRAFGYGQTPSELCARDGDWPGVAKWMAVGVAQVLVFSLKAAMLWAANNPARAEAADRAARGLGKVFWWSPQRFYGQAAAKRSSASAGVAAAPAPIG